MPSKLIVGSGAALEAALAAWRQAFPDLAILGHEVVQGDDYSFDVSFLDRFLPAETTVFAAFDNRFLNFKRLELMGLLRSRGFRMEPFVSPRAAIGAEAKIGDNAFIGDGSVVGAGASVQYCAFVGARAVLGDRAQIGYGAWIEPAVVIGADAKVGVQTTLGMGVCIGDGVDVGRLCVVDVPGIYRERIPAKTFVNPFFDEPIRTIN